MTGGYDGSIRINTQIDTKNASAQIMSLENRIVKTSDKMAALRSKMDALKDAQVPTQEYSEISRQIERAESELNRLLEKQTRMQQEGKNNGAAWERLKEKINAAENTIRNARGELQILVDTGKAFTLGSETQEYADLARQLRYLQSDYDVLTQRQREVHERNKDTASSFRKLKEAVINTKNALTGIAGGFGGLSRRIKSTDSDVNRLEKSINRVRNGISGLIRSLGVGLSIAGIVALGKQAIETASDVAEVQNVVDTAFGSMSYKMEQFADTAVKQFGISKLSAKEMGSTFMAMGRAMMDSMEDASDMAINLTARAADMSSFYNKSVEETATALQSIYTGETETLKAYGVVMTEINLQEYAYRQGIKKKLSAMTQSEKVLLRYKYVMEKTVLAEGDFAKTSDSWANQTRILKEQFKELLSVAGTGLITVLTPVVKFLNIILTQLIAIATQAGAILSKLLGISIPTADSGKFAQDLSDASVGAGDLAEGIEAAGKAADKALAPFDKLNVLKNDNSGSGAGTGGFGSSFEIPKLEMNETDPVSDWDEKAEKVKEILGRLFNPFHEAWENEGKFVIESWEYALGEISELLKQLGKDFLRVWDTPETIAILSDILHIIGDIGLITGNLARNFRKAWTENDTGYKILCDIRDIICVIIGNIRDAADYTAEWADKLDFSPLLSNGEEWLESLIPVIDTLSGILTDFYTMVLLPLAKWKLEKGIPKLLEVFTDFNNEVDWEALRANLQEFWEHLEPFGETLGEGLIIFIDRCADALAGFLNSDEFDNFLHSIEGWMDKAEPEDVADALERIAEALIALKFACVGSKAVKTVFPALNTLWGILKKLGKVTGLGKLGASLKASLSTAWTSLGGISGILSTDMATIIGAGTATEIGLTIGTAIIGGIAAAIGGFSLGKALGKAFNPEDAEWYDDFTWFGEDGFFDTIIPDTTSIDTFISDLQTNLIAFQQMATDFENNPAIASLTDALIGPWISAALDLPNHVADMNNEIEDFGKDIESWWDTDIAGAFSLWGQDINAFWDESVVPWFTKEKWTAFGENMKTGISEKWKGFTDWWRGTGFYGWWNEDVAPWFDKEKWSFDGIKDGFESAWDAAISAVKKIWNKFAGWLNEQLTWTVDPVTVLGKTVFPGAKINLGKIPMLADGAVIRGGNPFMAVLGDQPRGVTNIETPLPTMVQAFKQAMAESGGMGGGEYTFIAQLNGKAIYEETVRLDRMQKKSTGRSSFA